MNIFNRKIAFIFVAIYTVLPLTLQAMNIELGDGETRLEHGRKNHPEILTLSCQYGRGSHVVNAAKANAAKQIADFFGSYSSGSESYLSRITDSSLNETHLSRLIEANARNLQGITFDAPFIQGDEMCVTGRLVLRDRNARDIPSTDPGQNSAGVEDLVTVQVTGEGFEDRNKSITARKAAENDALAKAVQQVVGMIINSGYMEQSSMNSRFVENDSTTQFAEATASFISTQARGHVKEWREITYQEIGKRKGRITIKALVVRGKIQDSIDDVIRSMGSPAVFVESNNQVLADLISAMVTGFGAEITKDRRFATLILDALAKGRRQVTGYQADIGIMLKEPEGAVLGKWNNEPSILSWPESSPGALEELVELHLEVPEVKEQINKTFVKAVLQIAKLGGPLRILIIPQRIRADTVKLERALRGVGGINVQSIRNTAEGIKIYVRFMGTDSALASRLQTPVLGVLPGKMHSHYLKLSGYNQLTVY